MISVIIPCYNHGQYLSHALNSVLSQTFTDWEAIIVDDGSTDETREVAGHFVDRRLHYVYQENQGLSAARNSGIRIAQGEYLAFLDADDEWEPEFLETVCENLEADPTLTAVFCRNKYIDENGSILPAIGGQAISSASFRQRILEGGFFPVHAVICCDS